MNIDCRAALPLVQAPTLVIHRSDDRLVPIELGREVADGISGAQMLELQGAATLYRPVGCARCNQSGYRGRAGIYELVEVDETLRTLIHDGASEQAMVAAARERYPSIQADGRRRILAGDTSLQEVLRVTAIA